MYLHRRRRHVPTVEEVPGDRPGAYSCTVEEVAAAIHVPTVEEVAAAVHVPTDGRGGGGGRPRTYRTHYYTTADAVHS